MLPSIRGSYLALRIASSHPHPSEPMWMPHPDSCLKPESNPYFGDFAYAFPWVTPLPGCKSPSSVGVMFIAFYLRSRPSWQPLGADSMHIYASPAQVSLLC